MITNPITAYRKFRLEQDEQAIQSPLLICDCSYDLGHFLLNFEYDQTGWQEAILFLHAAMSKKNILKKNELVASAKNFLLAKWLTHDPVCKYVALRIWQSYLRKSETFFRDSITLISALEQAPPVLPASTKGDTIPLHDPILRLPRKLHIDEEQIKLWIPSDVPQECVIVENSFYPLKLYYRQKLNDWGQKFCTCTVCSQTFLAKTRKQITCSAQCADVRKKKAKATYDSWARQNDFEMLYKRSYQRWYNRIKKARELPDFPPERLKQLESAFETFKEKSHRQKIAARATDDPIKTFKSWANQQELSLRAIMGEYEHRIFRKTKRH